MSCENGKGATFNLHNFVENNYYCQHVLDRLNVTPLALKEVEVRQEYKVKEMHRCQSTQMHTFFFLLSNASSDIQTYIYTHMELGPSRFHPTQGKYITHTFEVSYKCNMQSNTIHTVLHTFDQ